LRQFSSLFDLATGRPLDAESDGPASRTRVLLLALLACVLFGAIYGVAAGSTEIGLALGNVYKIPMVIVLSALSAVPATLLAWKLAGARHRSSDLLMGLASGNFTAALVLAVAAPVVALYYHTSDFLGGAVAMGASGLALLIGTLTMMRAVVTRVPKDVGPVVALPVLVMVVFQLATLVQLVYVASPILPEITVFDGGMDAVLGDRS
jgi:hypothetical protein